MLGFDTEDYILRKMHVARIREFSFLVEIGSKKTSARRINVDETDRVLQFSL